MQVESPAGGGSGFFTPPSDTVWRHLRIDSPDEAAEETAPDPRALGDRLFQALFTGRVRQLFDQSRGQVLAGRGGLRIRVRLDPEDTASTRLGGLPWELLYQAETRQFLGLSRRTPISRELVVPQPLRSLAFPAPLRILAVTANPRNTAVLDLARERQLLEQALRHSPAIHADFLEVATAAELRRALRREQYQVLHFMGHGELEPQSGRGVVLFEDPSGGLDAIPGGGLADELRDCESLGLVVLNACSTGQWAAATVDPFAGVAAALVLSGLPAVLAMQAPISDQAAIAFSHELYQHLADGDPVDAAVVEGRLAIQRLARNGSSEAEWATPVLYLRGRSATRIDDPRRRLPRAVGLLLVLVTTIAAPFVNWTAVGEALRLLDTAHQEPVEPNRPRDEREGDPVPDTHPSSAGEDKVPPLAPPRSTTLDVSALQQPPYRENAVAREVRLPRSSTVSTTRWPSILDRELTNRLANRSWSFVGTHDAEWLVVLTLQAPRLTPSSGGSRQQCEIEARLDLYYRRQPIDMPPLTELASAFTADQACEATVQKLATQLGDQLLSALIASG